VYTYMQETYSHREGRRAEPERKGRGGTVHKAGSKIRLSLQSIKLW